MEEYAYIKPKSNSGITEDPKWILRSDLLSYEEKWYLDATKWAETKPTKAP